MWVLLNRQTQNKNSVRQFQYLFQRALCRIMILRFYPVKIWMLWESILSSDSSVTVEARIQWMIDCSLNGVLTEISFMSFRVCFLKTCFEQSQALSAFGIFLEEVLEREHLKKVVSQDTSWLTPQDSLFLRCEHLFWSQSLCGTKKTSYISLLSLFSNLHIRLHYCLFQKSKNQAPGMSSNAPKPSTPSSLEVIPYLKSTSSCWTTENWSDQSNFWG